MNIQNSIEALLFVSNKPLTFKRIRKFLQCTTSEVKQALEGLLIRYRDSGVTLKISEDKAQLLTSPEYEDLVKPLIRKPAKRKLTTAAIEVLAIIASKGESPISSISNYRGKPSEPIVTGLVRKGMLKRHEYLTKGKRKRIVFRVTEKFRSLAGLKGIEEIKAQLTTIVINDDEPSLFDENLKEVDLT